MTHSLIRKVVLKHAKSAATMTVLVLETAGGFSYGVDNYISMPMTRKLALAKYNAVIKQYTTHQNFDVDSIEGAG